MILKKTIIYIFFVFLSMNLFAQYQITIDASILDKESNQPIPFVNIGFIDKSIGTVSDNTGKFTLIYNENDIEETDVIQFSIIGYETLQLSVLELTQILDSNNKIYLNQKTYNLDEIVLESSKRMEKRIGNTLTNLESIGYWKDKNALGGEIATLVQIKNKNTRIFDFKFNILENLSDSLKIRVNMYNYQNRYPQKNILNKNIFYTITKKKGVVTIDLKPYNIMVSDDIVVGIELIEVYGSNIGFAVSASKYLGVSYTKYISQDKWKRFSFTGMNFSLLLSYPVSKTKKVKIVRAKPTKLSLYWDRSLSMKNRSLEKELEFLSSYLQKVKYVNIEVVKFSNSVSKPKIFHITKRNRNDLLNYLRDTRYEGSSNYSNILKHNNFNADEILLFTNGKVLFSTLEPEVYIPIFIINTLSDANHAELQRVSSNSDGYYINLNNVNLKQALANIQNEENDYTDYTNLNNDIVKIEKAIHGKISTSVGPLQSATVRVRNSLKGTETDEDGNYNINVNKGDVLVVNFLGMKEKQILITDKNEINIELKSEAEILGEVVLKGEGKKEEELVDIGLGGKKNFDAIGTSINTMTEKEIGPQYQNFRDLLFGKFAGIQLNPYPLKPKEIDMPEVWLVGRVNTTLNPIPAIYDIDGRIYGNNVNAPYVNPQDVKSITILKSLASTNKYGSIAFGGVIVIRTKTYSAGKSVKAKKSALKKNNDYTEQIPLITSVVKKQSYIIALEKANSYKEALTIYDQQKLQTEQVGIPFYLDVSNYFMRWDKDFAYTILSNIAELAYKSPKALKTLAYRYEELRKPEEAKLIYQRIAVLQPKDAQSYRDLAHIYTETGNYKEAMGLYKQMLYNQIEGIDFTGLQNTIDSEIKHLVTLHRSKVNFKGLPNDYLTANFNYNTRIIFEWNDPYAEFELQFVNPQKKFFQWSHTKHNNKGRMLDEIKNGYYTEEYIIDNEDPGEWIINIQSFNQEEETVNPTYLKYTIYKNYGLVNESKTIKVLKLSDLQQKVTLDRFKSN